MSSRERILAAAQRLFAERGYAHVTVRQIAAEAGVSPALVMKHGGSKERIYRDATPPEQSPLSPDWPEATVGVEWVRRILERRADDAIEPWMLALLTVVDSPDPARALADFETHYVERLTKRAQPGPHLRQRAELVAAMLLGLAATARPLRLLNEESDWVTETYGSMIQSLIDG